MDKRMTGRCGRGQKKRRSRLAGIGNGEEDKGGWRLEMRRREEEGGRGTAAPKTAAAGADWGAMAHAQMMGRGHHF
jgi:hypothetical protein